MQSQPERLSVTKRVSLISAATNAGLGLSKILIGVIGNSAALIADGVHSFSDLLSDGLVYFAARMGDRRPDKEHPYGHRRIETVAVILIAVLLMVIGIGIIVDSIHHLLKPVTEILYPMPIVIVALISIATNEWLFRFTRRAGEQIQSDLLISNAWHNRSDALVSIIVLLSVIGAATGFTYLDAVGAGIIALLIFKAGFKMLYQSVNELIDSAVDEQTLQRIREVIFSIEGVDDIHMLRTRLHAGQVFVDVHILVDPKISVSEGHFISDQVQTALFQAIRSIADVTVHIDPEDDQDKLHSVNSPSRQALTDKLNACWESLPTFDLLDRLVIHYLNSNIQVELFFKPDVRTINHLDDLAKQYRQAIRHLDYIEQCDLHITL